MALLTFLVNSVKVCVFNKRLQPTKTWPFANRRFFFLQKFLHSLTLVSLFHAKFTQQKEIKTKISRKWTEITWGNYFYSNEIAMSRLSGGCIAYNVHCIDVVNWYTAHCVINIFFLSSSSFFIGLHIKLSFICLWLS